MATEVKVINEAACCGIAPGTIHEADAAADSALSDAATLFKALSDETRLRIVRTMVRSGHELCECNIVPLFGLSQSTISYHLKVLREAGLIKSERRGQWVYHQVNERAVLAAVRRLSEIAG